MPPKRKTIRNRKLKRQRGGRVGFQTGSMVSNAARNRGTGPRLPGGGGGTSYQAVGSVHRPSA